MERDDAILPPNSPTAKQSLRPHELPQNSRASKQQELSRERWSYWSTCGDGEEGGGEAGAGGGGDPIEAGGGGVHGGLVRAEGCREEPPQLGGGVGGGVDLH